MEKLTVAQLKSRTGTEGLRAEVHVQLQTRSIRLTRTGKEYLEAGFADATGGFSLKLWSDRSEFQIIHGLPELSCIRLSGLWSKGGFGLELTECACGELDASQRSALFSGDPATQATQQRDWDDIQQLLGSLADPRLRALCAAFLAEFGSRFRRTAAARKNHHARRGGLVEHVAQMLRSAAAICHVYPSLNRDLLLAGVLFHDCGKLWENHYPEDDFHQPLTHCGELLGHIPIGLEVANRLWRQVAAQAAGGWDGLVPGSEEVRIHLLHLIASHHGQFEFGSPTLPRTPEAWALHCIDNLDAKLEMMKDAYAHASQLAPGIYERQFPLPSNLVRPLESFSNPETGTSAEGGR